MRVHNSRNIRIAERKKFSDKTLGIPIKSIMELHSKYKKSRLGYEKVNVKDKCLQKEMENVTIRLKIKIQ